MTLTSDTKLKILFAYLVVCAASARGIPFAKPWGIDFHNLHVYQFCSTGRNPYLIPGPVCGDIYQRSLVYPPLLFHAFFWTRKLPLADAMLYWSSANLFMFAFAYQYWARLAGARLRWDVVLFCGLLVFQYPMLFLLERGGTDVVSVFTWTLASWCLCRRQLLLAGIFAGFATAYKLYPGIPTAIASYALLAGSFRNTMFGKADFLRFGLAAGLAFAGINALYWPEAVTYFTVVLPQFAATLTPINTAMHALGSLPGPEHELYVKLVQLGFFWLWCWSASRSIYDRPALTMAALLAISTYFSATSWDYNLVTVYPLLVMLFIEARHSDRWGLLFFGLFAIVGDRELWSSGWLNLFNPQVHAALQFAFLVVVAIELARPQNPARAPAAA